MRDKKVRRARFYYLPGIISLIMLPALLVWYSFQKRYFRKLQTLEVVMLESRADSLFKKTSLWPINSVNNSKYIHITLNGPDKADKVKLDYAHQLVRELVQSGDTTKGIHFHFGSQAKYWAWVEVLDMFIIDASNPFGGFKPYMAYKNDIWFYNMDLMESPEFEKEYYLSPCGGTWPRNVEDEYRPNEPDAFLSEETKELIMENLIAFSFSGLIFILLGFLSFKKVISIR